MGLMVVFRNEETTFFLSYFT